MNSFSTFVFLMATMIVINSHFSASSSDHRSCPEEYRELRRRSDESSSDSNEDQWREDMCEQAMAVAARRRNSDKNQALLRNYCDYYNEALALERENNDSVCQDRKRQIDMKRKRQESKKKRDDGDSTDSNSDDDDDNDEKRRALLKRQLSKRFALRFIRKRMP